MAVNPKIKKFSIDFLRLVMSAFLDSRVLMRFSLPRSVEHGKGFVDDR